MQDTQCVTWLSELQKKNRNNRKRDTRMIIKGVNLTQKLWNVPYGTYVMLYLVIIFPYIGKLYIVIKWK